MLDTWSVVKDAFPPEVRGEYIEKFSHSDTVHAICEEFRASPTLDYQQDEADRGNRTISCPVLFLWSQRGSVAKLYDDPLAIWQQWADDVRGGPVPVGHFIPEEAPGETTPQLRNFLRYRGTARPLRVRRRPEEPPDRARASSPRSGHPRT